MFRSKRSSFVKRLWKLCLPQHESDSSPESTHEDLEVRSLAQAMLKRLKESQLEMLLLALESKGGETTECVLLPKGDVRLVKRSVAPNVLVCQLFRWPTLLKSDSQMKRLPCCTTSAADPSYLCCNPHHWSLLLDPVFPPIPGLQELGMEGVSLQRVPKSTGHLPQDLVSTETGLTPTHYRNDFSDEFSTTSTMTSGPSDDGDGRGDSILRDGDRLCVDSNNHHYLQPVDHGPHHHNPNLFHWCSIAYWELRQRVGRLYVVREPSLSIFQRLPHGSGMCLEILQSETELETVRKTREKIGLGLILSREGRSVWAYNRSQFPVFVNSPTLEEPNCKSLVVWKVPPGHSVRVFDYDRLEALQRTREREFSAMQDGPYDPWSVRVSFAKGWGPCYSRQFVTSCPCWLEILLKELKRTK